MRSWNRNVNRSVLRKHSHVPELKCPQLLRHPGTNLDQIRYGVFTRLLRTACRPGLARRGVLIYMQTSRHGQRTFFLDSLPPVVIPPVAFLGLLISLWTYKCMMMILFQNKIIYMPYVPPFSRSENVNDYANRCRPVQWDTKRIRSLDGTKIALCVGEIPCQESDCAEDKLEHIVICYFQGNGSSIPPRLPMLSSILKLINTTPNRLTRYTIVALSYRGYWISSGRASQTGIELDARALLDWVEAEYGSHKHAVDIVLWGQSIGAGVASTAAAAPAAYNASSNNKHKVRIAGLILETPFSNIRSMLSAIYPQKWLPYGYLWPFLWNHWDTERALERIAQQEEPPKVLLLPATKDEIVPPSEIEKLDKLCKSLGLGYQRQDIHGALHTEATQRSAGKHAVAKFILDIGNGENS